MKADYRHTLNRLMEFFERRRGALYLSESEDVRRHIPADQETSLKRTFRKMFGNGLRNERFTEKKTEQVNKFRFMLTNGLRNERLSDKKR